MTAAHIPDPQWRSPVTGGPGTWRPLATVVGLLSVLAMVCAWLSGVLEMYRGSYVLEEASGYTFSPEPSSLSNYLRGIAAVLIFAAGAISGIYGRARGLGARGLTWLAVLLFTSLFWIVTSYEPGDLTSVIVDGTSPFVWICCLGVLAGMEDGIWKFVNPAVAVLAVLSIFLGMHYALNLPTYARFTGYSPLQVYLNYAIWFSLYLLFNANRKKAWTMVLCGLPLSACLLLSVYVQSRSWTAQSLLAVLVCLYCVLTDRAATSKWKPLMIGTCLLVIVATAGTYLYVHQQNALLGLLDRTREDTRTEQYKAFFEQVSARSLITGGGPRATYQYSLKGAYDYIDNLYLFILFKFGLLTLLAYASLVLVPGLRVLRSRFSWADKAPGLILLFWMFAMGGMSVYSSVAITPYGIFLPLLAGRCRSLLARRKQRQARVQTAWIYPGFELSADNTI